MTVLFATAMMITAPAFAQQYVNGYERSNGTYVQGYYRSQPDGNPYNNYSTQGNVNPYTGQPGTVNPQPSYRYQPAPQPQQQQLLPNGSNGAYQATGGY